jgi:hypothetical protein
MVEVGIARNPNIHVTFNHPFPSAPQVVVSPVDHFETGGHCTIMATNITPSGFDYFADYRTSKARFLFLQACQQFWIATLQQ